MPRPSVRATIVALGVLALAAPVRAQWEPVAEVPRSRMFSISATGDTIAAGADSVVFLSTDGGKNWLRSARPVTAKSAITAVRMRNHTLFAASYGQGVSISNDLGATWIPFNDGLVSGPLSSEFDVVDFVVRGNDLLGATAGSGIVERALSPTGPWHQFGGIFEPNQDGNVNAVALGGTRLLASAGVNGQVYERDPGDADWTQSHLDNIGLHPGLAATAAIFNGFGWVVGTNSGVFRSTTGLPPWTRLDLRMGGALWTTFAAQDRHLFGAFDLPTGAAIAESDDDGASWGNTEFFPSAFVQAFAISGGFVYAARADGVWRRPVAASASVPVAGEPTSLRFAVAGAQPFHDGTRVRFVLPAAGRASVKVFDVLGRSVGTPIDQSLAAGPQELALDARSLSPGVYTAVLGAAGRRETLRLVHLE